MMVLLKGLHNRQMLGLLHYLQNAIESGVTAYGNVGDTNLGK